MGMDEQDIVLLQKQAQRWAERLNTIRKEGVQCAIEFAGEGGTVGEVAVPSPQGDSELGCTKVGSVLWECRGCGPDRGAGTTPVRGVEGSRTIERVGSDGKSCSSEWREVADPVPQEEPDGVAGDLPPVGPSASVPHGGELEVYATGAMRSFLTERYDLVPSEGVRRVAAAMAHGAIRYGEDNWQKGMPMGSILNHALAHIYNYLSGDRTEDHLGHACANLMMACHFDKV